VNYRAHIKSLVTTFRDIRSTNKVMGGITLAFSGGVSQILFVIVRETRANIKFSKLRKKLYRTHLSGDSTDFPKKQF